MARLIQANPGSETVSIPMPSDAIVEAHFLYCDFVGVMRFGFAIDYPLD
jgi:hypothetical protein